MSEPREVLPGRFYLITRRCTQRQFLLRPDRETNNAFMYCLIEAAKRFEMEILLPCAMSNHHHTVLFDRHGRYPEFLEHFHKMLANCMNALRRRSENFWSSEQTSAVVLVNRIDVMAKLVYTATNPVKADLVERVEDWPGVNGLGALLNGETLRATRPKHFFSPRGKMPAVVEMKLTLPEELADHAEFLDELRQQVAAFEVEQAAQRKRTGRRVMGAKKVLAQAWRDAPRRQKQSGDIRPRFAAKSKWARIEEILRRRSFLAAYAQARQLWREGREAVFPAGTYWLRRFANVQALPA